MKIQMFVYPGMTLLDMVGPLQTWSAWPGAEIQFVGKVAGPVVADSGLAVIATHSFADAWTDPGILFTPGGGTPTYALLDDEESIAFLADRGARAGWVTSVCTGALLLGAAGLLRGYRATSHWYSREALAKFGAIPVHERWVIDRNRATGGGVTAGIDFGLALTAQIHGEPLARMIQLLLEYSPKPPFSSGTPEEALPETRAMLSQLRDARPGTTMEAAVERAAGRLAASTSSA